MGELAVHAEGGVLRTLLGSCVGVALFDRRLRIGGLAHVVLPRSRGQVDQPGKFADTAIPELMKRMEQLVDQPMKLTRQACGGSKYVFNFRFRQHRFTEH